MSNSTRPGGYDERLVVPLEASRRGAHRARVNPLVAALPLLAVIAVVAAVVGIAYQLFLRPHTQEATEATPAVTQPAAPAPTTSQPAAADPQPTRAPSPTAGSSAGTAGGKVDKAARFSVYNGTETAGLARKANKLLKGDGFSGGSVMTSEKPASPSTTTVYYAAEAQAATAKAMAKALGGVAKLSSTVAASGIVVVVAGDVTG